MGSNLAASDDQTTESVMSLPPSIVQKLQADGMQASAINTDAADAFERGEFIEATLGKWLTEQKAKRPHLWIMAGQIDLEQSAFGDGNMTARSRLTKELGEATATERAKEWGLKGIADFKTRGSRPGGEQQKEKPKGDNPWSAENWNVTRQGSVAKADFALAQRLAKAAGSYIGATKPAKVAA
jgi:hypothetical protein